MSEYGGFILLYRRIMDCPFFDDEPFSRRDAWMELIMLAKYRDEAFYYRNRRINGKRGVVYRSISSLAKRWGWDRKTVKKFLNQLENEGMIEVDADTNLTSIRIVNYNKYQDLRVVDVPNETNSGFPGDVDSAFPNDMDSGMKTGGVDNEIPSGFPSAFPNEIPSDFPTYNNINNNNKENNTYSDIELSKSAAANPDEDSPLTAEDDDEDDGGEAFYRMMVEQYGPEVK